MSDQRRGPPGQGWTLPRERQARLAIAKGYPYTVPDASYLFRDGAVRPLDDADFRGRTPVLGHGSNRSPEQLERKFGHLSGRHSEIPVTFVWLHDYDVVYSAHMAGYGSVTSTLQAAQGCRVRVAINWLDEAQLQRMHETEGNYSFGHLKGVTVQPEAGPKGLDDAITMYLSDHGCLSDGGVPLALAAVPAEARPHRAHHQEEALDLLRRRLAPGHALDDFILHNIDCAETRRTRVARMKNDAIPADVPHFEPF